MPSYVALLRGINVGGKHLLPMADLREVLGEAGATSITTYIQSGNVVFAHRQRTAATLAKQLATAIEATAGFAVPVVLRTAPEWTAGIAATPFRDPDVLHCAFLPAAPTAAALAKLDKIDRKPCLPSEFAVSGREVYFHLPEGIGRDKLAGAVLRALPDATVRNWRTVMKLAELLAAIA